MTAHTSVSTAHQPVGTGAGKKPSAAALLEETAIRPPASDRAGRPRPLVLAINRSRWWKSRCVTGGCWTALSAMAISAWLSYRQGQVEVSDLTGLMRLALQNQPGAGTGDSRPLAGAPAVPAAASAQRQHPRRQPAQYPRALRHRQRFLSFVARPEHDLFQRLV